MGSEELPAAVRDVSSRPYVQPEVDVSEHRQLKRCPPLRLPRRPAAAPPAAVAGVDPAHPSG